MTSLAAINTMKIPSLALTDLQTSDDTNLSTILDNNRRVLIGK